MQCKLKTDTSSVKHFKVKSSTPESINNIINKANVSHVARVLDNAQTAVFTSTKSAQYVQILLLRRKQTSRILRGTSDFRVVSVRPLSERQQTGKHFTFPGVTSAGSTASCHDNIITAAGQSCTTKQSVQSASGRLGLVAVVSMT